MDLLLILMVILEKSLLVFSSVGSLDLLGFLVESVVMEAFCSCSFELVLRW